MISFDKAYSIVMENSVDFGEESIPLEKASGRVLAEDVFADRDFPPFDRVTKDGIAIAYESFQNGNRKFKIQEIAAAGDPEKMLENVDGCIETMTGAMLPKGTDTIVMYEHLHIENGSAKIEKDVRKGQNLHSKGADSAKDSLVLAKNIRISAAEIGVLATVGKHEVLVKKLPRVAIISTGNELVDVHETPEPHQIRKSNSFSLQAALKLEGIKPEMFHLQDREEVIETALVTILSNFDVLLLSGGVSKGKYDFLPQIFNTLQVEKLFHRVKQRPGKPFWFGKHIKTQTTIFAFPGNPVSTFANYHVYFLPWLYKSLELAFKTLKVVLVNPFENKMELTLFKGVKLSLQEGVLKANLVGDNGSGDLTSLCQSNGLVLFEPLTLYQEGQLLSFYRTKHIFK